MSLVAFLTLATATLFIVVTQGQQLFDAITSALSIAFWELVVPPLLVFATLPFVLLIVIPTCILILAAFAFVIALALIIVNSPTFCRFLHFVTKWLPLIAKQVVQLHSQLASIKTSIHAAEVKVKPQAPLESKSGSKNGVSITPVYTLSKEPRRFNKRRPINYSGAKPTLPLDPRNDAHTRFIAHIKRIQSKAWYLETLKEMTPPTQQPTLVPVATVATPPIENDPAVITVETPSTLPVCQTSPEIIGSPTEKANVESSTLAEALGVLKLGADPASLPSLLQTSTAEVQTEAEPAGPEAKSEDFVATVEASTPIPNIPMGSWAPPTELPAPNPPLLSANDLSASLSLYFIAEPTGHVVTEQAAGQDITEIIMSIITENSSSEYISNNPQASIMEQPSDIPTSTPVSPGGETNQSEATSIETPLSSTFIYAGTEQGVTQLDLSTLIHIFPNQLILDTAVPEEVPQAEMDIIVMPAYQDMLIEMELFDGLVDAPPTFGMSAPPTVDQGSQPGYMHNISESDVATFANSFTSDLFPHSADNHGIFELDTAQVDTGAPLPSDSELLELAAAALATEGMDWMQDTLPSSTSGLQNESSLALPLTDQQLLELDNTLLLAGVSLAPPAPQSLNPLEAMATDIYINPYGSAPLTNDELPQFSGATMSDNAAGVVMNKDSPVGFDFNLDPTDTDMSSLDSSLLELLDQATQSVAADFTYGVLGPSGLPDSYDPATLGPIISSNPELQNDPNELAGMWDELGALLKGWVEQIPSAMDFSEENMMQMLMEFDPLDTTCSPSHMTPNQIPTSTTTLSDPAPPAQSQRKIKRLPLRRNASENHA